MNSENGIEAGERSATGSRTRWNWIVLAILLLAFSLRILKLDGQSLWWDETLTVYGSNQDMISLLQGILERRVHPPLFYVLMHFWLLVGKEQFVVQTFAVFWGTLSVAAIYPVGRMVGGHKAGVCSTLLLAVSPYAIWYSQEARMYSLTAFLVLIANYFLMKTLREDHSKYWIGYSAFTLLAIWTHHICLFIIPAQLAFVILNRGTHRTELRACLTSITLIGLLYLPWVVTIFATGGFHNAAIGWVPFPQLQDLFWTPYVFTLGSTSDPHHLSNILVVLLCLSLVGLSLFLVRKPSTEDHQRSGRIFLAYWLFVPAILVFLISLDMPISQKRSIYMDRYFTLLLPAYIALVACGLSAISKLRKELGLLALLIVLMPTLVSLRNLYFDERYFRDDWRGAVRYIQQEGGPDDPILMKPSFFIPVQYYYEGTPIPWVFIPEPVDIDGDYDTYLSQIMPEITLDKDRFWQIVTKPNTDIHRFVSLDTNLVIEAVQEDTIKKWLDAHYQIAEEKAFNGVFLTWYEVD